MLGGSGEAVGHPQRSGLAFPLGFRGLGFRFWDLGFRILGLGFRI